MRPLPRRLFPAMLALLLSWAPSPAGEATGAARDDLDALVARAVAAYAKVGDFECTFRKKERIRDEVREKRNIRFKFRKPASYYMKLTEGDDRDTELIYVAGKYDGRMRVHLGGFWGFFKIAVDPKGSLAMKNNRHPVTDADIGHILDLIVRDYRKGKADPGARIDCLGEEAGQGRPLVHARGIFPPGRGYYGHEVHVWFDRELRLPVRMTVHGWQGEFLEEYAYADLRLDVGLTDRDFDVTNPDYGF